VGAGPLKQFCWIYAVIRSWFKKDFIMTQIESMTLPQPVIEKMQCMEVWGGNRATWSQFSVPGLDLWVHSEPYLNNNEGGDVYYLSSCASGRITRVLLADVSGHGASVSPIAVALRDLMRKNINFVRQSHLVRSINEEFESISAEGAFATALIGTFFAPTKTLWLCNAGHPMPLIRRASSGRWECCDTGLSETPMRNMPIGIIDSVIYRSGKLLLDPGDMVLAYTDSLSESLNELGQLISPQGVRDLLQDIDVANPGLVVPALLSKIQGLHTANLSSDDTTVMLLRANGTGVSFIENFKAPFRLLRGLFGRRAR